MAGRENGTTTLFVFGHMYLIIMLTFIETDYGEYPNFGVVKFEIGLSPLCQHLTYMAIYGGIVFCSSVIG
jgi:hypothetical protein